MGEIPPPDIDEDIERVRRLLVDQATGLGDPHAELELVANGWDNFIYRWRATPARTLAVRVPRRLLAIELTLAEQRWLPELATHLDAAIPVPLLAGSPTAYFPHPWSVTPWFEGVEAMTQSAADNRGILAPLATFLTQMHRPAPPDAPLNTARNGHIGSPEQRAAVDRWLADDAFLPDNLADPANPANPANPAEVRALWRRLIDTPPYPHAPSWIHGDLHSGNILVNGGELAAVVDFGDLTAGDPAADLAIAYELFEAPDRAEFRARIDASSAESSAARANPRTSPLDPHAWDRARAWALYFALISFAYGAPGEAFYDRGIFGLTQVLEG